MDAFLPEAMNIELTTKCPLKCPQCYCSLEGGKEIPLETAKYWLAQGKSMGVKQVELSGGETLCYSRIYELKAYCREIGVTSNIALSGCYFDQSVYERLVEAGIGGIFVSLNGSSKEINSITRDGYELAINALRILCENGFEASTINWVMHSNNADDFWNVIKTAEKYRVNSITVMAFKPDAAHQLNSVPNARQMEYTASFIRQYNGSVKLRAETCFSPMLALAGDTKLFGNMNIGKYKGCLAERSFFNVNVDGKLSPCRHLEYFEEASTLEEYWNNSKVLDKIRSVEADKREPCSETGGLLTLS